MIAEMELPLHMRLTEWPRQPCWPEPIQGHRIRLKAELVDFTEFVPIYGSKFVSKLLDSFARASAEGRLARPQAVAHAFAGFLRMVAAATAQGSCEHQSHLHKLYEALRDHGSVDRADVEASIVSFIERARDLDDVSLFGPILPRTRNNKITALRTAARELGPDLGWHGVHLPRAFGLVLRTTSTPTPSLGEMRCPQGREATGHSAVEVMRLNKERLTALRAALVAIHERAWEDFCEGESRIGRKDLPDAALLSAAVEAIPMNFGLKGYDPAAHPLVSSCFPLDDDDFRCGALLKYLALCRQGILVRGTDGPWARLLVSCGGLKWLVRRLGGDAQALAASHGIVMIDTGFNVQPCDDLLADPIVLQAKHGHQVLSTVTSNKMRSQGKPVLAVLREYEASVPVREPRILSSIEVIRRWRAMSGRYRERAAKEAPHLVDRLWLRPLGGSFGAVQVAPLGNYNWQKLMQEVRKEPRLAGLSITRRAIRTTVIQLRLADSSLEVAAAALVAGHAGQVTTINNYLNKGWFRSELDQLIRQFQQQFESLLVPDSVEAARSLRVSHNELHKRRTEGVENGLGLMCSATPQPSGNRCEKVESCAGCKHMNFVPTPSSLRALALTERSLSAVADVFSSQNPQRWAAVWLPTLALARAIIGRLCESYMRSSMEVALAETDRQLAEGTLLRFRPW